MHWKRLTGNQNLVPDPQEPPGQQEGGSFDQASSVAQMAAIRQALTAYFGADKWLEERRRTQPGLG